MADGALLKIPIKMLVAVRLVGILALYSNQLSQKVSPTMEQG